MGLLIFQNMWQKIGYAIYPDNTKQQRLSVLLHRGEVNLVCDQNRNDFFPVVQALRSLILLKTAKEELLEVGFVGSPSDCAGRSWRLEKSQ